MANDTYGSTWKIDTAAATVLHAGPFHVKHLCWVSPNAAAGDLAEIQDSNGKTIFKSYANGPNFLDYRQIESWWNQGFKVPTLTSGEIYIVVK